MIMVEHREGGYGPELPHGPFDAPYHCARLPIMAQSPWAPGALRGRNPSRPLAKSALSQRGTDRGEGPVSAAMSGGAATPVGHHDDLHPVPQLRVIDGAEDVLQALQVIVR